MATRQISATEKQAASTLPEKQLVERAQAGDAEAFGQLYETLVDPIYRYIYFRVSDGTTAEDLTSQVFLKAWEHLPHYHAESSPILAWVYTIAHNTVIDHYRVQRPADNLEEAETIPSRDPLPAETCETQQECEVLQHALQQLTREQRDVIVMRLIDGMGTEEIAARLGKRCGAVRAAQMRGLQALARILGPETPVPFKSPVQTRA